MIEYTFQEDQPKGFTTDFDEDIFHHTLHLKSQAKEGWCSLFCVDKLSKIIYATVDFNLEGTLAQSPLRSPYGSYIFSENFSSQVLQDFIQFSLEQLSIKGVKKIVIKNPPEVYCQEKVEVLQDLMIKAGFKISITETSAVIPIGKNTFESVLHYSERKKLQKCREAGLEFQWLPLNELESVYAFLLQCREKKKFGLSMSLDQLKEITSVFPKRYFLSVVKNDHEFVAANISIRVNNKVLYNFYHDHDDRFDNLSPVVFLNEGLYTYCQQKDIKLLDLGTSNLNDKVNESLLNFKMRLGAQPSHKLTFEKILS